jgi:PII-like signaling protein
MRLTGALQRLTVLVGESDRYGHHPLSTEVVHRAHAAGLAGASVFHGTSGFGASRALHTAHVLSLSDDLPVAVVVVDTVEKVQAFLPQLDVVVDGLVLVEDVQAV